MGDSRQAVQPARTAEDPTRKDPYVKPSVAWEDDLESRPGLTAACDKISGSGGSCDSAPAS
jgi:hypothetical protein